MDEQDKRTEQEDVEGHGKYKPQATEDAPTDEGDDDVELHGKYKPQASEDAPKDEGDKSDFELHGKYKPQASEDAPKDDGGDEGDFELHRTAHKAL